MSRSDTLPRWTYRLFKIPTHLVRFGFGRSFGPPVMILTTTGRKSGLPRRTALQYELIDGVYYAGSMRGAKADWYRNILANPQVALEVRGRRFPALAQPIDDSEQVLGFLKYRLARSPRMIRAILRAGGLRGEITDTALRNYAKGLTIVAFLALPETRSPSALCP